MSLIYEFHFLMEKYLVVKLLDNMLVVFLFFEEPQMAVQHYTPANSVKVLIFLYIPTNIY